MAQRTKYTYKRFEKMNYGQDKCFKDLENR